MSKRTYIPERGDLVELNFQPAVGREIDNRRPAVVISPVDYNRRTGLCIAVPVTSKVLPGPFWLDMPPGHLSKPSQILCDFVKSFDWRERSVTFVAKVPDAVVGQVVERLFDVLDPI